MLNPDVSIPETFKINRKFIENFISHCVRLLTTHCASLITLHCQYQFMSTMQPRELIIEKYRHNLVQRLKPLKKEIFNFKIDEENFYEEQNKLIRKIVKYITVLSGIGEILIIKY